MTKKELLFELKILKQSNQHSSDDRKYLAVTKLLLFINDKNVTKEFRDIEKL